LACRAKNRLVRSEVRKRKGNGGGGRETEKGEKKEIKVKGILRKSK